MRLDSFLVELGKVASRSRAKQAIIEGGVRVDGKPVNKPSKQVSYSNKIEVVKNIDVPAGYLKLKSIQDTTNIIHPGDYVLDLGSSAGGFLQYASEIAARVKGIEYSNDFIHLLEELSASRNNITIMKGDVFTMPISEMSEKPVDVILNDITVAPEDSIKVLEKVLPLLKPDGRLLQVLKLSNRSGHDNYLSRIKELELTIKHVIEPQKREIYVVAVRNQDSEANQ
ncbi:MAG: methyltransferase domain-containing protein [Methanosarcinales archaeon]|nr:methyltransferase domain-containing protein [Methanosarcinales archaeon]